MLFLQSEESKDSCLCLFLFKVVYRIDCVIQRVQINLIEVIERWIIVFSIVYRFLYLVDEEIRKNQLERKMKNGEIASFGEKYNGQFDREFYTTDERGNLLLHFFRCRQIHRRDY